MRKFDYINLKNEKWDNEILGYIATIHEVRGKQSLQKPECLERLVEIAKIQSTESSNSIEGIKTTNTRLKQLVNQKIAPKNIDEQEIAGYRDALSTIHNNFEYIPLTSNYILQLHKIMFAHSSKDIGGKFKSVQNYISATDINGKSFTLFTPFAPFETSLAIEQICQQFNKALAQNEVDVLILIPIFIHDFLCVHPFLDGNGRISRLLTTLLLYRSGYYIGKYISLEAKIANTKDLYYDALEKSQEGWHQNQDNPAYFIKYLLGIIVSAYRDLEAKLEIIDEKLPALEMVKKAIENQIGKISKRSVMALCPTLSSSSVEIALRKLCAQNFLTKNGIGRSTYYTKK